MRDSYSKEYIMYTINDLVARRYELEDELLCCEHDVFAAEKVNNSIEAAKAIAARSATKTLLAITCSEIERLKKLEARYDS